MVLFSLPSPDSDVCCRQGRCSLLSPPSMKQNRRLANAIFHGCDLHIPDFTPSKGTTATAEPVPGVKSVELSPWETRPCSRKLLTWLCCSRKQRSLSASLALAPHSSLLPKAKTQPSLQLEAGGLLYRDPKAKAQLKADWDGEPDENTPQCGPAQGIPWSTHPQLLPPGLLHPIAALAPTKK